MKTTIGLVAALMLVGTSAYAQGGPPDKSQGGPPAMHERGPGPGPGPGAAGPRGHDASPAPSRESPRAARPEPRAERGGGPVRGYREPSSGAERAQREHAPARAE